jgi:hypothetical protein
MEYIAIIKRVGDLKKRPREHKKSSPNFPLQCVEGDFDDLKMRFPDADIMSIAEYHEHKNKIDEIHGPIELPKKPWWKFWSKT